MSHVLTEAISQGATVVREKDSTCCVTFWYIPGGANYDQATDVRAYFKDLEAGRKFAKENDNMPEMAMCIEYDEQRMQAPVLNRAKVEEFFEKNYDNRYSIHHLDDPNHHYGSKFISRLGVKFPDNNWYKNVEHLMRQAGNYRRLRCLVEEEFILE